MRFVPHGRGMGLVPLLRNVRQDVARGKDSVALDLNSAEMKSASRAAILWRNAEVGH